ncbi:aminodeoxychorismate synthase component I [Blastococcus jejuensis]|uniref:Aminodeoxychorismate synthase component I n=1 Tax=Blastococcus jejuensis TaxID=351224 RepID=A0ABP6P4P4_9ACTN
MSSSAAWARFDDLVSGTALLFSPPHRVLTARRPEDVVPVLAEVDRATARGDWAFGYVSYEAASGLDPTLAVSTGSPEDPPLSWFGLCRPPAQVAPVDRPARNAPAAAWAPGWSADEHARAVARVRDYIAAGETYQVNLTDRLRTRLDGDLREWYAGLALAQRGASNAYLDLGRHVIASASPELFFDWTGDRLRTRPMKGTATRGRTTATDREQAHRLRTSDKERAENLMIVDLLRNDVARVAEVGTVDVPELFALERYPTVWQLTSEITARTRPDVDLVDVFRALFPCGSVTGAPKTRTMQLIRDLESGPRGVYCGAIGLVAPPGAPFRARFNVAIRTAVIDRATETAVYGAGGGITWDSDPAAEHAELLAKAAVLTAPPPDCELLETLAYTPGEGLRNLDRHLARLADSAEYFGHPCNLAEIRRAVDAALPDRGEPARVRIRLSRRGRVSVDIGTLPAASRVPVCLAIDDLPVDSASVWLAHKTSRRDVYEDRAACHPGADDVVLVNERGEVTETTVANLAIRIDGCWWTPPVSAGCLPGVERARLLEREVLQERALSIADLHDATGLAVVNSLRGWRPAVLIPG